MKKGILVFFTIFLVSCAEQEIPIIEEVSNVDTIFKEEKVQLYIKDEYDLGLFEPERGVYLGAYTGNAELTQNSFESSVGTDMAFKVFQYTAKNSITNKEILECIANEQMPYIKYLLNEDNIDSSLYHFIGDLSSMYKIPIFIELYPLNEDITDPRKYKENYIKAYQEIKEHVPEAVIVWCVDYDSIEDSLAFYPGDTYLDWAGLNIYMPKYKEDILVEYTIENNIDVWYKLFQDKKPLMISGLAISNYSNIDNAYTIFEAQDKLKYFYEDIPNIYPRIKSILYVDIDMRRYGGDDDYRITADPKILNHVVDLWDNTIFLEDVISTPNQTAAEYKNYNLPAYTYNDVYYIEEIYLESIIDKHILDKVSVFKDLEGNIYYPLEELVMLDIVETNIFN
ncbi:MAG: hypothetical protein BEN19_04630 [Epulopiscium sp. Nuni2H_MBin003]|nr:MAG: hypothetical protein BEN19_04630 [Epulopiscium sp. Nuni2H_MBin003]